MSGGIIVVIGNVETGVIEAHGGSSASVPSGYLFCDGSAVSRITFAPLFAVIGTNFGIGDGSTTFNLPDLRDGYIKSVTSGAAGTTGGTNTHTLTTSEMPAHTHELFAAFGGGGISHDRLSDSGNTLTHQVGGSPQADVNETIGGGGAHNNEPVNTEIISIIKT